MLTSASHLYFNGKVLDNSSIDFVTKKTSTVVEAPEFDYVIPEFVDLHCHGGGGRYFWEDARSARNIHRENGTGIQIASLVTLDKNQTKSAVRDLAVDREIWGIHLEGPYLSPDFRGAHDETLLRKPDISEISELLDLAQGKIAMVTIAPELEGALDLIRYLIQNKVIVALGHSGADSESSKAAIDAGATLITHFNNAMAKLGTPNSLSEVALANSINLEVIPDFSHIPTETLQVILAAAPDRCVAVTDAMSAAGCGDGSYLIGNLAVTVKAGQARLDSNGKLAGSTLTMLQAFHNLRELVGFEKAVAMTSMTPRKILGIADEPNYIGIKGDRVTFLQNTLR